jgi:protein BCP1
MLAAVPRNKKQKKTTTAAGGVGGTFSFHPEDEHIQAAASHTLDYSFTNAPARDKEAFGLDTGGRIMVMPFANLAGFVSAISQAYAVPT